MKSILSLVGFAAWAAASIVSQQIPLSPASKNNDTEYPPSNGVGKDFCEGGEYNVTLGVVDPKGGEALPVIYREGKLWVVEVGRAPTVWTLVPGYNKGRFFVYTTHPSGARFWWNDASYDDSSITVKEDWGRKELSLAAAELDQSPFTRSTIFWDQRCLVSDGVNHTLKMTNYSHCDLVAISPAKTLEWRSAEELCQKQQENEVSTEDYNGDGDACNTYSDCTRLGCLLGYRCCRGTEPEPSECMCADVGLDTGWWYGSCH